MSSCGCSTPWVAPTLSIADVCSGSQYVTFMSLVDLIIRASCRIADPCNRIIPKTRPAPEYDFIVIGAGSGGSTIAGRLAEVKEWNTLLVEAGMDEPVASQIPAVPAFKNSPIDWNFTAQQGSSACLSSNGICNCPRGKVLGGTSVLNGMLYIRGTIADYQKWVDAGNSEWSYEKLLPVFKASEDNREIGSLVSAKYHGTGGPFTIQRFNYHPKLAKDILVAAQQSGFPVSNDLNGDQYVGFTIPQTNTRNGQRLSLAKAFVRPHRNSENFDVMLNSTVTKILIAGERNNKRATAVQFVYHGITYTVKAKKEIILAAGTFQTPQVLLLSGIGAKDVLDAVNIPQTHNLTGVGKGMKNHVAFQISGTVNILDEVDLNNDTLNEYLSTGTGFLSSTGTQVTSRLASSYTTPDNPDIQLSLKALNNPCAYNGSSGVPNDPRSPNTLRTLKISSINLHPKSTGYITLHSNNPFDKPKIVANYLTNPDDIKVVINGVRIAQHLVNAPILKDKYNFTLTKQTYGNCSTQFDYDTDAFWECAIRYNTMPENHQAASCKIGLANDPEACVDQYLRVHGIPNLRITDASVMRDVPSGNTQATVVAIAERASWFIKEDWSKSKHLAPSTA